MVMLLPRPIRHWLIASRAEQLRFIKQEGRRIIRQNPFQFAKNQLRGMMTLAANPGATDVLLLIDRYPRQRSTHATSFRNHEHTAANAR